MSQEQLKIIAQQLRQILQLIEGSLNKKKNWAWNMLVWYKMQFNKEFPTKAPQLAALKRIKLAGYNEENIKKAMQAMWKDPYWKEKRPDFITLARHIDRYLNIDDDVPEVERCKNCKEKLIRGHIEGLCYKCWNQRMSSDNHDLRLSIKKLVEKMSIK